MMLPIDSMCCQFSGASLNVLYTHVISVTQHIYESSYLLKTKSHWTGFTRALDITEHSTTSLIADTCIMGPIYINIHRFHL